MIASNTESGHMNVDDGDDIALPPNDASKKQCRVREKMSCNSSAGFVYDMSLRPGETLYRFLVSQESERNEPLPFQRLRMWIPDTIVVETYGLCWYYSNADGFVCCTSKFTPENIVSKLGSVCRHPDEVICVSKTACWETIDTAHLDSEVKQLLPNPCESAPLSEWSSGSNENHSSVYSFVGNDSVLLSLSELRDHCDKLEEVVANTAAGWGVRGQPCVQRFIKPKGKHAFMVRTRLTSDDPIATDIRRTPMCWLVQNNAPMVGKEKRSLFVQYTGPFSNDTRSQEFMQSVKLIDTAEGGGTVSLAREVWRYLEYRLRKGLDELVVDFVKDDLGTYWMTQIKGFKFRRASVARPLKVRACLRPNNGAILSAFSVNDDATGMPSFKKSMARNSQSEISEDAGDPALLRSIVHARRCDLCRALYSDKELRYRLSRKAAHIFILHLRARLYYAQKGSYHPETEREGGQESQWPYCLQPFWEDTLIEAKRSARRTARSSSRGGTVGNTGNANGVGEDQEPFQLCDYCFKLYEKEDKLIQSERKLVNSLGLLIDGILQKRNCANEHKTRFQMEMESRFGLTVARAIDYKARHNCIPIFHGSIAGRAEPLTMCRAMIAVHEIMEFPISFLRRYDNVSNSSCSTFSRHICVTFELLGSKYCFEVPIPTIPSECEDNSTEQTLYKKTIEVPVGCLKILHFIAPGTKARERPFEAYERVGEDTPCGLSRFLKEKNHLYFDISVVTRMASFGTKKRSEKSFLLRNNDYDLDGRRRESKSDSTLGLSEKEIFPVGRACLSLGQFQSSYINYTEVVVPVVWDDFEAQQQFEDRDVESMPHIRISVGMQRILENVPVWSLPEPLLKHRGLYVAPVDSALSSPAPLPPEWVALNPQRPTGVKVNGHQVTLKG